VFDLLSSMIDFESFKGLMLDYVREEHQDASTASILQCCSVAFQPTISPSDRGHTAPAAAEAEDVDDTESDTAARFDAACSLQAPPVAIKAHSSRPPCPHV
jgi:hypothetical protein